MSTLEDRLVDYTLSLRWEDLSTHTLHQAQRRMLDTIGGALAAYLAPPVRIARRLALPVAGDTYARIWGSHQRVSPEMAAFVNGSMLRYLDINDTYRTVDGSHPSDNLGGLVAVAEMLDLDCRDLLLALVLSYEVQCRFVDSVPFNDAGWDQPVPGVLACALACGRMLGLDAAQLRHAIGLALIPNLCTYQTRAGELSMWKGCAAANGARQGVFAAMLAGEGMTGPDQVFDGVFGVWKQTMGKAHTLKPLASKADDTFAVAQSNIKKYPVRDSCQLPVDTARALRAKLGGRTIETLRIETYRSAYKGAVEDEELWAPRTRETADHSMLVAVTVALLDGTVGPQTFDAERFKDEDVLSLIRRTTVDVVDEFTKAAPGVRNCRITATATDGTTHVGHLFWTLDDIARGLSDEEVDAKFHALNRDFMPARQRDAVIRAVRGCHADRMRVRALVDLLFL
jgi:2-methylcitrate dehydratase